MKSIVFRNIRNVLAAAAAVMALAGAGAQEYPGRPITLVIPTGAGGGTDLVARVLQKKLAESLGQPVVIDNKAGAGGIVGNQFVARAAPDGYTLLMSSNQFAIISAVNKSTPYDPRHDFQPVSYIGLIPTLVVVNPKLGVTTIQDLVAAARRNPKGLQFGSAGSGSPNHLFGEMFNRMAGVDVLHVPYKGIAPALTDVVGGTVSMAYASLPTVQGFLGSGQLKALAVTSSKRLQALPELPTLAEVAPGYEADIWLGLWAVARTPPAIVQKVHAAMATTLQDPEVRRKLADLGLVVEPRSAREFEGMVHAELDKWSKVVSSSNGAIARQ
jgi:tripartite-type tricarboxylate transporter receptor subunit TctC